MDRSIENRTTANFVDTEAVDYGIIYGVLIKTIRVL